MSEREFLDLCFEILEHGDEMNDRTGTGIYCIFSPKTIRYDLRDGKVPAFTTKRIAWKNTIRELLWFISGSTDSTILERQGCNWWKENTTREFLDSRGLHDLPVGDIGKMYGYQWRKNGVDQLARLIENIKATRDGDVTQSRRLLMTAYIPQDLQKGVLEPCHTFIQFHVSGEYLDCALYQRSGDMFLGVQINILSYSILTYMIAMVCGLKPRFFFHHLGNAHVYASHVRQMRVQIDRETREYPTLKINPRSSIDDFVLEDFSLENYNPHPGISAGMCV